MADQTAVQPGNLERLHGNLSKKDGFTVPLDQFKLDMQDENNLKKLHGNLSKKDGFNVPYDQFKVDMLGETPTPAPQFSAEPVPIGQAVDLGMSESILPDQIQYTDEAPGFFDKVVKEQESGLFYRGAKKIADLHKFIFTEPEKALHEVRDFGEAASNIPKAFGGMSLEMVGQGLMKLPKYISDLNTQIDPTNIIIRRGISNLAKEQGWTPQKEQYEQDRLISSFSPMSATYGAIAESLADSQLATWTTKKGKEWESQSQVGKGKTIIELANQGDYGTALGKIATEISRSLPFTIATAAGGLPGLAAMGAMTASKEYDDIKDADASVAAKLFDATLNGAFESLGEYLGTHQIMQGIRLGMKGVKAGQAAQALSKGFEGWMSNMMKNYGLLTPMVAEGLSESFTTLGQNGTAILSGVDPERKWMDGVSDAFITSFTQGGIMGAGGKFVQYVAKNQKQTSRQATSTDGTPIPTLSPEWQNNIPPPRPTDPRAAAEYDARQFHQTHANPETGMLKKIETILPGNQRESWFVTSEYMGPSGEMEYIVEDGSLNPDGSSKKLQGFKQGQIAENKDVVSEISQDDYANLKLSEFDAQQELAAQIADNTMMLDGQKLTRQTTTIDNGDVIDEWIDENGMDVEVPPEQTAAWDKAKQAGIQNPDIISRTYGKTQVIGTKDEAGNIVVSEPMTQEQAIGKLNKVGEYEGGLKSEVERTTGKKWTVEPGDPIEQLDAAGKPISAVQDLFSVKIIPYVAPQVSPSELGPPPADALIQGNISIPKPPDYSWEGKGIDKKEAIKRAKKAIHLDDKSLLKNLIHSDPEIQAMVDKKWPQLPAVFKIKGKKITPEDALDFIEVADNIEQLQQLKHENLSSDAIVEKAYNDKVNEFIPAQIGDKSSEKVEPGAPILPVNNKAVAKNPQKSPEIPISPEIKKEEINPQVDASVQSNAIADINKRSPTGKQPVVDIPAENAGDVSAPTSKESLQVEPKAGDVIFDNKKGINATIKKVYKPKATSALANEPFVMDLEYEDGAKSMSMPMGDRFKPLTDDSDIILTAFEKKTSVPTNSRTDVESDLSGLQNDTATPQNTDVSDNKGNTENDKLSESSDKILSSSTPLLDVLVEGKKKVEEKKDHSVDPNEMIKQPAENQVADTSNKVSDPQLKPQNESTKESEGQAKEEGLLNQRIEANIKKEQPKVQKDVDDALKDFMDAFNDLGGNNLGIIDNTAEKQAKMLVAGTRLIGAYTKAGVYHFREILLNIKSKGISITEDLLSALKKAYGAFAAENDIEELDDIKTVRNFKIEELMQNENNSEKNDVTLSKKENTNTDDNGSSSNTERSAGNTEDGMDERQPSGTPIGSIQPERTTGEGVAEGDQTGKDTSIRADQAGGGGQIPDSGNNNERSLPGRGAGIEGNGESNIGKTTGKNDRVSGISPEQQNHVIKADDSIVPNGETAKIRANIKAIKLAKSLEKKNKNATPAEKKILAQYVGWGGLAPVFKNETWNKVWNDKYGEFAKQLKELITPEELRAAKESTINAHYTDRSVIDAMWKMVERMGFKGGRILEPAGGIGHFFGLMPESISSKSTLRGVELDKISGLIFSKLYPQARIDVSGFEEMHDAPNSYDLTISNVPFAGIHVHDSLNKDISKEFTLHNYFIAKSIRLLKPGGVGAFITTSSTMDNEGQGAKFRAWVNSPEGGNADLIDAIRLPNNAFKENAGTEVTTDVLFFRKRDGNIKHPQAKKFLVNGDYGEAKGKDKEDNSQYWNKKIIPGKTITIRVNEFYLDHPDRMLGEMRLAHEVGAGGLYNPDQPTLHAPKGLNVAKRLDEITETIPENIFETKLIEEKPTAYAEEGQSEGEIVTKDGKPYIVSYGELTDPDWNDNQVTGVNGKTKYTKAQIVDRYNEIKRVLKSLVIAEATAESTDEQLEKIRKQLNEVYDKYNKDIGQIEENSKTIFLRDDVDYSLVSSLENSERVVKKGSDGLDHFELEITKAGIFTKRMNQPREEPKIAGNIDDALDISFAYRNELDMDYMSTLTGISTEAIKQDLLQRELAYENPLTGIIEDKDNYLSGYVRKKLKQAETAAAKDSKYKTNIEALRKVIPNDIPLLQIQAQLGASWINPKVVQNWIKSVIELDVPVFYNTVTDKWSLNVPYQAQYNVKNKNEHSAGGKTALDLILAALNQQLVVVYDKESNGSGGYTQVKNESDTAAAQGKVKELKNMFQEAVWDLKGEDATSVIRSYNDLHNAWANKNVTISENFTHFPGASKHIKLNPHQIIGVKKALAGSTMLAHQVGVGKTFELITISMEMKRLGLAKKPMIVVQKATTSQFVASFRALYPSAKILVPSKKDLEASERKKLFAKIALNEWDAVIIYHDFLTKIPDKPDRQIAYINERIDELEQVSADEEVPAFGKTDNQKAIEKLKDDLQEIQRKDEEYRNPTVKDQAKKAISTRTKLQRQFDRKTDKVLYFEDMGVDALLVDEAHTFKRLGLSTKGGAVKGIDTSGSQKSVSAKLKTRFILENNNQKNVIFATGTPISNTMAEAYTMMNYLIPERLKDHGIKTFDDFRTTFGSVDPSLEFTAAGKFKFVDRFAKYINLPELQRLWQSVADVVLTEEVPNLKAGVGTPLIKDGKPTNFYLKMTKSLENKMEEFKDTLERWDKLTGKEKRDLRHIPLVIFNLAKRAAIDVRLVDSKAPDDPGSKTNKVVSEIKRLYDDTNSYKGTQLVFSDMIQSSDGKFNLHEDIKQKLVKQYGIPESQVQLISDHDSDAKREKLFEKVNSGEVRIVIGSTDKLGIGVNVQERLRAVHHIDAPARPMDYEQRNGRLLRQGNLHLNMGIPVEVLTYGVEKTLDATAYQRLDIKQKFIHQMMKKGISIERTLEEEDEDMAGGNFAQIMANLSGSQYAILHISETLKLQQAEMDKRNFQRKQIEAQEQKRQNEYSIENEKRRIEEAKETLKFFNKNLPVHELTSIQFGKTGKVITKDIYKYIDEVQAEVNSEHTKSILINGKIWGAIKYSHVVKLENDKVHSEMQIAIKTDAVELFDVSNWRTYTSAHGLFRKLFETVDELDSVEAIRNEWIAKHRNDNITLDKILSEKYPKQDKLDQIKARVADLEAKMQEETTSVIAAKEKVVKTDDLTSIKEIAAIPDLNLPIDQAEYLYQNRESDYFNPDTLQGDKEIARQETIIGGLTKSGLLEDGVLTDKGRRFIDLVNKRKHTRMFANLGIDLFPESTNIPEITGSKVDYNQVGFNKDRNIPLLDYLKAAKDNTVNFSIVGQRGAANIENVVDNLTTAKEMTEAGKDKQTIFLATGWEKFLDGWKYDLPDGELLKSFDEILNLEAKDQYFTEDIPLNELLSSNDLFNAYPELKEYKVRFYNYDTPIEGQQKDAYSSSEGKIFGIGIGVRGNVPLSTIFSRSSQPFGASRKGGAYDRDSVLGLLLHETQHIIQGLENFGRGSNAEDSWGAAVKKKMEEHRKNGWYEDQSDATKTQLAEDAVLKDENSGVKKTAGFKLYKRAAGEVEARNVQTRLNLSPEARKQQLISATEDVSEDQKIYLVDAIGKAFSDGGAQSTLQTLQASDDQNKPVHYKGRKAIIKYLEGNSKFTKQTVDKVKNTEFMAIQIGDEVFINSDNVTSSDEAVRYWIHERFHVQLIEDIPNGGERRQFLNDLYRRIGKNEIQRVVPESYWNGPIFTQAEEYLTHLAEQLADNGAIEENIDYSTKMLILDTVNKFTTLKKIQDVKNNRALLSEGSNGQRNENNREGDRGSIQSNEGANGQREPDIRESLRQGDGKRDPLGLESLLIEGKRVVAEAKQSLSLAKNVIPPTIQVNGAPRPTTNSKGQLIHPTREGIEEWNIPKKQAEKYADKISDIVNGLGKINYRPSVSITDFGVSIYVQNQGYGKIRFSDHGVMNFGRVWGETHYRLSDLDNVDGAIITDIEKVLFPERYKSFSLKTNTGGAISSPRVKISNLKNENDNPFILEYYEKKVTGMVHETPKPQANDKIISERPSKDGSKTIYNVETTLNKVFKRITNIETGKAVRSDIETTPEEQSKYREDKNNVISPNQIKSATGNNGSFSPNDNSINFAHVPLGEFLQNARDIYEETKKNKRNLKEVIEGIRKSIQDTDLSVRRLEEKIKELGGRISDARKPYRQLNLAFGRMETLYQEFADTKMKPIIKTINKIRKEGVGLDYVLPYAIAKQAIERNPKMRDEEAQAIVDDRLKKPTREAIENDIDGSVMDEYNILREQFLEEELSKLADKDYSGVTPFDKRQQAVDKDLEQWMDQNPDAALNEIYTKRKDLIAIHQPLSPDELANNIVNDFEAAVSPQLVGQLWDNIKNATDYILNTWVKGGAINKKTRDKLLSEKYFVPLRGWRQGDAKDLPYTKGEGFGKSFQRAEGRKSLAANPFAYIQEVAFKAIGEQVDLESKKQMLNLVLANYSPEFQKLYRIKKAYYVKTTMDDGTEGWMLSVDADGGIVEPSEDMFISGDAKSTLYSQYEQYRTPQAAREHEVIVHSKNGDIVIVFLKDQLEVAQAMNRRNVMARNLVTGNVFDTNDWNKPLANTIGLITNWMKATMTQWNVQFPVSNFPRDMSESSITQAIKGENGAGVIKHYKDSFPAIIRAIRGKSTPGNKYDDYLKEFKFTGGVTGFTHSMTPDEIERKIGKDLDRMMRDGSVIGMLRNLPFNAIRGISAWNMIFEDATRLSVYINAKEGGKTSKEAASEAKEASVNFNRKGKMSKAFDSWFGFFNAVTQGAQKNASLFKRYPKRAAVAAASFVLIGYMEALMNASLPGDDDDDYWRISEYMRQNYLILPNFPKMIGQLIAGEKVNKGDRYLSFPLPHFWRAFKSLGTLLYEKQQGKTSLPMVGAKFAGNLITSLTPVDIPGMFAGGELNVFRPFIPTFIQPVYQIHENMNYMGFKIANEPFTKAQEKLLADSGLGKSNVNPAIMFFTDAAFRAAGGDNETRYYTDKDGYKQEVPGWMDWNPSKIQHIITGYTAGTGKFFMDVFKTAYSAVAPGETIDFKDIPFVNAFIRKTPEAKWNIIKEYYSLKKEIEGVDVLSKAYYNLAKYDQYAKVASNGYYNEYAAVVEGLDKAVQGLMGKMDYKTASGSEKVLDLMKTAIGRVNEIKLKYKK